RELVREAFRAAGLTPEEQGVPGCDGANLLATLPGARERWVLVGAHYDHVGQVGGRTYWGADDNAAAVAILLEVARRLAAHPPQGRGVLLAAFDGEEPPYFLTPAMGSEHWARHPTVPLRQVDLMVCMDLVGHALGPPGVPPEVARSLFALGAEHSEGTSTLVDRLALTEPGLTVRRVDAEVLPPMSDYWAFWGRQVPFLFLTCGRWRHYHTPEDTPDKLDLPKVAATARWLERLVREACARPEPEVRFLPEGRDDAGTLRSLADLTRPLAPLSPAAAQALRTAEALLQQCDAHGRLPASLRSAPVQLTHQLEAALF
ncbi:MAG: M28 family peptidase, partial [Myxococcaceae bacterium]|nr:M28 family peptidase [Myxococcaceae bacterium]